MSKGNFDDPHTARLMESFALLTAQLHQRLDEDVPEIANGVMQNLAPQLLRSFPSSCIVQFQPDAQQGGMTQVRNVPAGFELQSNPIDGQACRFLTHYPLRIWPAVVDDACLAQSRLDDTWQLRLSVQTWPGSVIRDKHLRVWLQGSEELVHTLLAQLCTQVQHIRVRHAGKRFDLPVQRLRHVGFEQDELLLHKQARTVPTHSLMLDFVQFAQRFHFLDLPLPEETGLTGSEPLEWEITFRRNWMAPALAAVAPLVSAANFQINCTPALNLFACRAEPITLQSQVDEHPVIADMKNQKSVVFWAMASVRLRQVKDDEAVTTRLKDLGAAMSEQWIETRVITQPATVPGGAALMPIGTKLGLSCGELTTALTSANLREERVFRWAPGQCRGVSLSVVFPQGELTRQWLGDDAWPRFLQELASGEHRYALEAFEAADPLVFSLQGVNEILVRFSLEGHEGALERWRAWQRVMQAMSPVQRQISALQGAAQQQGNYFTGNLTALPVSAVQCPR